MVVLQKLDTAPGKWHLVVRAQCTISCFPLHWFVGTAAEFEVEEELVDICCHISRLQEKGLHLAG